MKNKKTVKSAYFLVLISFAVLFVTSGCEEFFLTVPSWARGNWAVSPLTTVTVLEITSKEFIPQSGLSITGIEKKEVTFVNPIGNTVHFDTITVEQSGNQIKVGVLGQAEVTLSRTVKLFP